MLRTLVFVAVMVCAVSAAYPAVLIAEWNFNSIVDTPLTVAPSAQAFPDPNSQFGLSGAIPSSLTARATHYTSATDKSSDPIAGPAPNNYAAYNTQGYDMAGNKVFWQHSTAGYKNIYVEFDYRRSTTAPIDFQWVYSTDLGDFWNPWNGFSLIDDTIWHNNNASGILPLVCDNAPGFTVGVMVANAGGNPLGTVRYDMLQVFGDPIPEPSSMVALVAGVLTLGAYARRRRR